MTCLCCRRFTPGQQPLPTGAAQHILALHSRDHQKPATGEVSAENAAISASRQGKESWGQLFLSPGKRLTSAKPTPFLMGLPLG